MNDVIIDYEALAYPGNGVAVNMAAIAFPPIGTDYVPTFQELISRSYFVKFDVKQQRNAGKIVDQGVLDWWKSQVDTPEIYNQIKSDPKIDVLPHLAIDGFLKFCEDNGVDKQKSFMWTRGNSYDIPFLIEALRERFNTRETLEIEPVRFWNIRDIRTFIEATLMRRGMSTVPLPMGTLPGFIKHNPIHDCAKDILMMVYAWRYAVGLSEIPTNETCDPASLK